MSRPFVPHDDQREAIRFLHATPRAALWMRLGGGKSVSTLKALCDLDTFEEVFPALILGPKRVIQSTWTAEVEKWAFSQHLRVSVATGSAAERAAALHVPADIYCCSYDNLVWLVDTLGKDWPFRTVVADELSRLKSFRLRQGGKNAAALGKVAHDKVERFIGLTGTPAGNGLKDLWGQSWFLDKGQRLGHSFSAFEQRWFRRGYDGFTLEPMAHAQDEIQTALKDICLTTKGEPVDKPVFNTIYVDLKGKVLRHYDDMEKEFFAEIGEEGVEAANAAVKSGKLLQICNGAIYKNEGGDWEHLHDAKLEALESVVEEAAGMPVLVAYTFKHDLARILKRFPGARHLDANPQTIKDWNKGNIQMLVAHPASAGHGINLQDGGNIIVFFGVSWNLEEHEQIIERIGPMRQKQSGYDRPVFVHRIVARGTIDEDVLERLTTKRSVQSILLAAMERRG